MIKFCTNLRHVSFRYISTLLLLYGSFALFLLSKLRLPSRDISTNHTLRNHPSSFTKFKILIWNEGQRLQRRFVFNFSPTRRDPYRYCSVRNCILEIDRNKIAEASAVIFHFFLTTGPHTLPTYRRPEQYWILFTDESPLHSSLLMKKYQMKHYNGIFNLTMTYRSDSDIPVPYGRTAILSTAHKAAVGELRNFALNKTGLATILGSNCRGHNARWKYVRELRKYIKVDIYGACGIADGCPARYEDCDVMKAYKFYLAFESSNCREYITEKLWWNAYSKEVVPVVMGGLMGDYDKLCPPNSFIHVEDFEGPRHLAAYLTKLAADDAAYNEFFQWKKEYRVLNEHGYGGAPSLHLCRVCEALNSPKLESKVYNDLDSFWNAKVDCRGRTW